MSESFKSRLYRIAFNFFPCYRRTGVRVTYVSLDQHEVRIELPLNWKTRGYNGTLFGGSMYACVDPVYMTMLSILLGRQYVVWDRAATIDFKRAGRSTLYSTFKLPDGAIEAIRGELQLAERAERIYDVELVDAAGVLHAAFKKTIVIRKRKPQAETQVA